MPRTGRRRKSSHQLHRHECQAAVDAWKKLGEFLIVRYNDGVVKRVKNGKLVRPETGNTAPLDRPGYPQEFLNELVKSTGERYKMIDLKY